MADGEECNPADWVGEVADIADIADIAGNVLDAGFTIGGLIAKVLPNRQCAVQINNESSKYILRDPRVYMDTGICAEPLAITINPSSSGEGLFTKAPAAMRGSGGVFTYDLYNPKQHECVGKMATLYKVPYDLNLKSIVFAIGLYDMDTECDKHLFHSMFKGSQNTFVRAKANGSCVTFMSNVVSIRATMSNCGKAFMKIEVR